MAATFRLLKAELLKVSGVAGVSAGTDDLYVFGGGSNGVSWPGKTPDQDFYVKIGMTIDWVKPPVENGGRGVSSTPHTVTLRAV